MPNIILLTGYRRSGKDTFFNTLIGLNNYTWYLYGPPLTIDGSKLVRVAFADNLKMEVQDLYDIPINIEDKDKAQFLMNGNLLSARDIYIKHGMGKRMEDPLYWVKKIISQLTDENKIYVITDWRFKNEYDYLLSQGYTITTMRIYRADVPEPSLDDKSERDLDRFKTDYLVISDYNKESKEGSFKFPV